MIEKIISLESANPIDFFGTNNSNFEIIKNFFPKIIVNARGTQLSVKGDEKEINIFEKKIKELINHCCKYNSLNPSNLKRIIMEGEDDIKDYEQESIILFGNSGKIIKARTPNQKRLKESSLKNDLMFAIGPAGSGKTYTAIAIAVRALKNKEVRKIVLSRPAVEAGESLGFLPGDMKEKIDPYLQPLYDALNDMIPPKKLEEYIENSVIQIAPLAYMRGRTLNEAFVILDEAQNTTHNQMKMFLTRMGIGTKFVITGDISQIDLKRKSDSGLTHALKILKHIKGIDIIEFNKEDIVRHKLVKDIVEAYSKEENK